jgi:glutamate 5-kinase
MDPAYAGTCSAVIIDPGAHSVLSRRESGGRLPAAGVLSVRGAFASGQAVRILVRKKASGAISEDIEAAREEYVRGLAPTQAGHQLRLTYCSRRCFLDVPGPGVR